MATKYEHEFTVDRSRWSNGTFPWPEAVSIALSEAARTGLLHKVVP